MRRTGVRSNAYDGELEAERLLKPLYKTALLKLMRQQRYENHTVFSVPRSKTIIQTPV